MFDILHDLEINAKPNKIFRMVSTPEGLNAWWTKKSKGMAAFNQEYQFYFSEAFDWKAKVIDIQIDKRITYQMTSADEDWTDTIVSFEIIPLESGNNILRFEHRNWKEANNHFRKSSLCWAEYLMLMKKILEND